ncbi:MAG: DUF971 domain-containing protein [Gammaproteobacteria bacterium]|nr:DUF971 domain-containing protein [Gammaproteobacteria bacterium]
MKPNQHLPTEINLHRKSRLLVISFDDGSRFELPCEYLRVNSHAAEVKTSNTPITGKEEVNIERIEPQGNYAVRISFDDGHDTGIYSWETLYELGQNYERNWQNYLARLKAIGYERGSTAENANQARDIQVLYFAYLAKMLRKEQEQLQVPSSVQDVTGLLKWLRVKWRDRGYLLEDDRVRVTVNRQFAEPFTRLDAGDEVAITPNSPNPPPPPSS